MTTTAAPPGGHSTPLGLMSCVRESSPQDLVPQSDIDIERNETSKKRRFHPFRGLRKMFRRGGGDKVRTAGSEETMPVTPIEPTTETDATTTGHRSRSTSELLASEDSRKKPTSGGGALGSGALSVSHDSVFTAEQRSTSSDLDTAQSSSSLSIQQLMHQTGVRAELLDVVRRRGRGRGDTSEDEEDLGLPRSPCNSPTTTDKALKEHPPKSHSTCSDGSLLSMGSSEMDEDSFGQHSRHSSKLSLHDRRPSQTTDAELELGSTANATPLSHSAARHKMAVRPKRTHGAPRRRRVQQLTAGSALPTTPEVNEEISTRSLTPEGTATRETIAELYSSSSTSMNKVWSSSVVSETQLKSASLPPGLALPSGTSKLSRSRSNAGSRGTRDAFLEEDEPDDKVSKDDKKKEESFFGRFLARRSGKKKKTKSEDTEIVKTETTVSSYKTMEEKRTCSVDSGIAKVARSGPAARQRIQPIDIPASPDAFRHSKRQQQIDLDLPMPPINNSPIEASFLESSPPKKMHAFLPQQTKVTPSPEKQTTSELSPDVPIPSPRTILPHSTKSTPPTSPVVVPTVRTILPQSHSPPNTIPSEVIPAPRNILPQSTSQSKSNWPETQTVKTASQSEIKISEECKTKVKITGLSSYQQRVMSYNDDFNNAGFKSLDETSDDSSISTFPFTKSQSFRSKSVLSSSQDHSSLPFTVNSSVYDTNSDSETFTDSLMSTATTTHSTNPLQVSVTIKKSNENLSEESNNEIKIINTNADIVNDKFIDVEKVKDEVKIKEFIEKKVATKHKSVEPVTLLNDKVNLSEEKFENKEDGITISCVNSQMQASVNTKSSNQVVVSISSSLEQTIVPEINETMSLSSESIIRETTSQVSVTKVQLKRDSIKSVETPTTLVPEFLKIQLNKVDAKPTTNVVLSTSNSFGNADEKPKQKSVLEIETDRESGEVVTDTVKRKFSSDDVEIIDKDTSEEIVEIPSKNVTVTNLKPKTETPKPTLIINSHPRKTSLVSVSPVSPTTNKPFLKKKSNSLELGDSIKIDEKPDNSNKPLANSADELSCIKTETSKEKSASSSDVTDTPEVIVRKKSLVSQKRDKDSDEPELMKVFARRSLKLKDSEAESLSQQVLVLVEADNQNKEASESNKRDSDKENECSESPPEERKKSINTSKEAPKTKEPLTESKFVETADVTLRKPSIALNNKMSVFGGSKFQRTVSLSAPVPNNEEETEKRRNKSFIEPKMEKKPVIPNFRSPHIMNMREKDIDLKKSTEIKTKVGDEFITSSLKNNFENEDFVPRFKRIQQRKEEWEQRAQQNMKKSVP